MEISAEVENRYATLKSRDKAAAGRAFDLLAEQGPELARRMGTTQSSIARVESGGSLATLAMLARLARATGASLRIAAPGITDIDLGGAA